MSLELSLLGEILQMSRDPDVNVDAFQERVGRSPRLAAMVVRVSNSALYGMEGKIHELRRAVLILGIKSVTQISSGILVAESMRSAEIGGVSGDALWLHALETAICAELLARCLGLPLESEAYLAGLIHDLGIVDLFDEHGEAYADAMRCSRSGDVALHGLEESLFGETHGQRLARLAGEWGFPDVLQEAVAFHHRPDGASPLGRPLALLLRAAHVVVEDPVGGWRDHVPGDSDTGVLDELGLDAQDAEDVREELAARMKDASAVY